mgnify:CR=1 FL=1
MSSDDRNRWQERYRAGAYVGRDHPSVLLAEHMPDIVATQRAVTGEDAELRALDVACGAGRNALYLAGLGYRVDGLDIAAEALARADEAARQAGLDVTWVEHDLDQGLPRRLPDYDLIVVMRYLDLSLVHAAAQRLRPGGYLVCEVHLISDEPVIGPRDANFRARPGELRAAAGDLEVVEHWEGRTKDPDGRDVALARLVACRLYDIP